MLVILFTKKSGFFIKSDQNIDSVFFKNVSEISFQLSALLRRNYNIHLEMKLSILLSFLVLVASSKAVSFIGTAISAFMPCKNGVLHMQHESGRSPSLDNYFDGYLQLQHINKTLSEHVLRLVFVSPINGVTILGGGEGRIDKSEDAYLITFSASEGEHSLTFRVQGKKDEKFPDLMSLHIDGVDSCPEPRQWQRTPIGVHSVAFSDDFNSTEVE